jgi:hypothetical protein
VSDEAIALNAFNRYKHQLKPIVGNDVTNSHDLNQIGQALFPGKFSGVFTQDKDIDISKPYSIYNLDVAGQPGSHWISVAILHIGSGDSMSKPEVMVYDSFGRSSGEILPILSEKYDIVDTDYDAEQVDSENNCGLNCMCWLMVYDNLGPRYAELI